MAAGGSLFGQNEARIEERSIENSSGKIISDRAYNLVLGLVVAWGLLVNVVMCATLSEQAVYLVSNNPILFLVGYLVCAIAGIMIAHKSDNPVISFIGYNMVVIPLGIEITAMVAIYGGMSTTWVQQAFVDTLLITAIMVVLSSLFPQFFQKLGGVLFVCLIGIIVVGIVTALMGISALWLSFFAAVIFSLYIGYDYWRAQQYAKTVDNAVDSAVDLYLDIALLFLQLLQIFGRK